MGINLSMTTELAGMVAVVTGAAQGIGRAIAEELYGRGAELMLIDRNELTLSKTVCEFRSRGLGAVHSIVADLADSKAVGDLTNATAQACGQTHILINNAAIELDIPFGKITAEAFDNLMAINLRAPLLVSQALVPLFPVEGGSIINISSIHANYAFPNAIPYACSKAGLIALTRNMASELAPKNIRVNAICPGYIDTALWEAWLSSAPNPEELATETAALHPLGRRGIPSDVASAVAFFADPRAAWVTGTHLVVDGGLTTRVHP